MLLQKICLVYFFLAMVAVLADPIKAYVASPPSTAVKSSDHSRGETETTTDGSMLRNLWYKISNFFRSDDTSSTPSPPLGKRKRWENEHIFRRVPPQYRKGNLNHDMRGMMQAMPNRVDGDGIPEPFNDFDKMAENFRQPYRVGGEEPNIPEVRPSFQSRKLLYYPYFSPPKFQPQLPEATFVRRQLSKKFDDEILRVNNLATPYVEEFGVDFTRKRFGDNSKDQWRTEKFVIGSDPIENMDSENFMEEIEKDPYLFHKFQMKPIEIDNSQDQ